MGTAKDPVVHLEHLMVQDLTDQSGITPDHPVSRHDTLARTHCSIDPNRTVVDFVSDQSYTNCIPCYTL